MKPRHVLASLLALAALSCAGCLGLYAWVMMPPPPAPDLVQVLQPRAEAERSVRWAEAPEAEPPAEEVRLGDDLVDGRVTDEGGAPLHGATVIIELRDVEDVVLFTDAEGLYAAWVDAAQVRAVLVGMEGYQEERRKVELSGPATLDFELSGRREVQVFCKGLPDDSCEDVQPTIFCTHPALFVGKECRGRPRTCECPSGTAAIRGGGRVVEVPPGTTEAWLDFRDGATVTGRVVRAGEPVDGVKVALIRAPKGLVEDLGRGMMVGREAETDEDGLFRADGLLPGTWRVMLADEERRFLPRVELGEGDVVDLGTIALEDGGRVVGRVIDGLTGEPMHNTPVAASLGDDPFLSFPVGGAETDGLGNFVIEGLAPGQYRVFPVRSPFDDVDVTVREGTETRADLEVGEPVFADEQGVKVVTGGAGELVLAELDPDGAAARSGLRDGDVLMGARLLGVDLRSVHRGASAEVLRRYNGPGLTVIVNRGGRELEIDLE